MDKLSDGLFEVGRKFLGCDYPIICGAMTWVSEPQLVSAVCNQGAFACLAGGNTPPDILKAQIEETRRLTDKNFAVNLVTLSPAYREQLAMLLDNPVKYVVFAGGIPKDRDIASVRATGAKALCFASTNGMANRMISFGADALILEGMEAGGHVGHDSLIVLLQQVLFNNPPVPVFVAGGLTSGRICAHLLLMGAAGVQLATRFAVSTESCAHADFKDAFIRASSRDAVVSAQFDWRLPVMPVRALHNAGTIKFDHLQLELINKLNNGEITREEGQHELERFWMGGLRKAVQEGDVENGSLMAGQSVGMVSKIEPVKDIIAELLHDMEDELQNVARRLSKEKA